jgi:hypothetical protein
MSGRAGACSGSVWKTAGLRGLRRRRVPGWAASPVHEGGDSAHPQAAGQQTIGPAHQEVCWEPSSQGRARSKPNWGRADLSGLLGFGLCVSDNPTAGGSQSIPYATDDLLVPLETDRHDRRRSADRPIIALRDRRWGDDHHGTRRASQELDGSARGRCVEEGRGNHSHSCVLLDPRRTALDGCSVSQPSVVGAHPGQPGGYIPVASVDLRTHEAARPVISSDKTIREISAIDAESSQVRRPDGRQAFGNPSDAASW